MIFYDTDQENHIYRIVLIPNRSISWPILIRFYIFTCFISFSIASIFAFLGYWMVLPFSGLEMLALGIGLYLVSRKIYAQEVVTFHGDKILIEKGFQRAEQHWEFDKHWAKVSVEKQESHPKRQQIFIGSHGTQVELGAFLHDSEKESLAFELNAGILSRNFVRQPG